MFGIRVPDDYVGVAAGSDGSLLRIHAKNPCRCGRSDLDKAVDRELTLADSIVVDELQPVFNTGTAVGNLGKVVFAENLLIFKTEWAMVGRDYLKMIVLETVP